jgi:Ca-activated chloride channel family protein
MKQPTLSERGMDGGPVISWWRRVSSSQRSCLLLTFVLASVICLGGTLLTILVGGRLWNALTAPEEMESSAPWAPDSAVLTIAVSPGMAPTLETLADGFNRQELSTPDGKTMEVRTVEMAPQEMVEQSLQAPDFQALTPDSSLWLDQLERQWVSGKTGEQFDQGEALIPLGLQRSSRVERYATTPIVIAAWEDVARDLGWPDSPIGWEEIQQKATEDPDFKWNHPSTSHASGLLATLAEFYAGAGRTRGLTERDATDEDTLAYVQAVEATVRFYGESEDVIVQKLAEQGRSFLDAFVAQEQVVVDWNRAHPDEPLVAIYPAEGTLWTDHPLALLALEGEGETAITDNQSRAFNAFAAFLKAPDAQRQLLAAGYRPVDLSISLDQEGSPFAGTEMVDWRQPQTTLQMPSASVVEVVQNVWWYTKRPTNVYLVVDTSGSMSGDKLARTQEALKAFISQIRGDRDRVGLIEFGTDIKSVEQLETLDDARRQALMERIERMEADGETALMDAVWHGYESLRRSADDEAINALVVMTDGRENASSRGVADLTWRFEQEGSVDVVVFTIAFGRGADERLLERIAEAGDGQFRRADQTDIEELYRIISTYF